MIRTATNYDDRVHSQDLDNSCGTSAPAYEVVLLHHLRTSKPRYAEANTHVPHVDVPISPPLLSCDYLAAVRHAVSNPYQYTSDICIRSLTLQHSRRDCLGTWTTETITASDMHQQWQLPTRLVPSHSSRRQVAKELPYVAPASIGLCVLSEHDCRVRLRRLCGRSGAQPRRTRAL